MVVKLAVMEKKRTYFRPTSAQQRRLMFETWEATSNGSLRLELLPFDDQRIQFILDFSIVIP